MPCANKTTNLHSSYDFSYLIYEPGNGQCDTHFSDHYFIKCYSSCKKVSFTILFQNTEQCSTDCVILLNNLLSLFVDGLLDVIDSITFWLSRFQLEFINKTRSLEITVNVFPPLSTFYGTVESCVHYFLLELAV